MTARKLIELKRSVQPLRANDQHDILLLEQLAAEHRPAS